MITRVAAGFMLAAAWLAPSGAAAAQDAAFSSAPDIVLDAFSLPHGVAVGDFDSDGRHDLAITDLGRGELVVRLGDGDGTFTRGGTVGGLAQPTEVVVGNFDSDGHEDIAVAAGVAGKQAIAVLRGVGDGTYQQMPPVSMPARVQSLTAGDFDGDGRDDLAAVTSLDHVCVLPGLPGGGFGGFTYRAFTGARSVAAGDSDGDGDDDLAVIRNAAAAPQLTVFPGADLGEQPRSVALPGAGATLAVSDFDIDGGEDVAATLPTEDEVSVRLGRRDGTLSDGPAEVPVGDGPYAVAVGDVDSDGREDLAVTNSGSDSVSVRLGAGDGGFAAGGEVPVGDYPVSVAVGDFDADGRHDLAVANRNGGTVSMRLGAGRAPLAGNLLLNGGFEQGPGARVRTELKPIPAWTTSGGMTARRYGTAPRSAVPSWLDAPRYLTGGTNMLWGGNSSATGGITEATQTADVSRAAEAIDAGRATAHLSAHLGGGLFVADHMRATAEFLSGTGAALGALQIGPVAREDRRNLTTMLRRAGSAPVPAGTRHIRVTLTSDAGKQAYSSAIADNVKLTLDTPEPSRPTPGSPPAAQAFGPDTRVTIRLARRWVRTAGPLAVRVANGNAFAVAGTLRVRTARGNGPRRRPVELPSKGFAVAATASRTLRLALPRKLRRELARRRRVDFGLTAAVVDPAGNRRTVRRRASVRLKPRRAAIAPRNP